MDENVKHELILITTEFEEEVMALSDYQRGQMLMAFFDEAAGNPVDLDSETYAVFQKHLKTMYEFWQYEEETGRHYLGGFDKWLKKKEGTHKKTYVRKLDVTQSEWIRLRQFVFKRDNFTCQYCGKKTPILNVTTFYPFQEVEAQGLETLLPLAGIVIGVNTQKCLTSRMGG